MNVKSWFSEKFPFSLDVTGLLLLSLLNLLIIHLANGLHILGMSIAGLSIVLVVLTPLAMGIVLHLLRRSQSSNVEYLYDYITMAISEGLTRNATRGIHSLINSITKEIPNYKDKISELDEIFSFLSDLLIANLNTTYIRDVVLKGYEDLFAKGVEASNEITYTVTGQLRMLSEQIVRRENALASRKLLFSAHKLFQVSLEKKSKSTVVDDACVTYYVVSRDILRERLSTIISLNSILIGTLLYSTTKDEKLDILTHRLLDLLEEYVEKSTELKDPNLIRAVKYYAKQHLDMIEPRRLEGREKLQRRVFELAQKIGPV